MTGLSTEITSTQIQHVYINYITPEKSKFFLNNIRCLKWRDMKIATRQFKNRDFNSFTRIQGLTDEYTYETMYFV